MSLLLFLGNFLLWSLLTIISGLMGGIGLAGGFAAFKGIQNFFNEAKDERIEKKNRNYLDGLEAAMAAGATQE